MNICICELVADSHMNYQNLNQDEVVVKNLNNYQQSYQ